MAKDYMKKLDFYYFNTSKTKRKDFISAKGKQKQRTII